jgi:aspartate carbamoyltransferase catalytic subunit
VANLFFEDSTRTRLSFQVAEKKLGAKLVNFQAHDSSMNKGESVHDTIKTIESLGTDVAIIRHADDNLLESLRETSSMSLINAGAGKHEHPTQALLDLLTMKQEFGKIEGLTVTICGDIKYSRVASSNRIALEKLGAKVLLSGPRTLLPEDKEMTPFDEAITQSDVVMMLRIQTERHVGLEVSKEDYLPHYGLTIEREKLMKKGAIIMHPAPVNRGVEIDDSLVEHERSRIFKQMQNGVFTRMAILEWICS